MFARLLVALGLMLFLCCSAATATQNLNSATGYVLVPDASVAPNDSVQVSGAYLATEGKSELSKLQLSAPCHGRGFNLRAITGIGEKAEAGIGWLSVKKDPGTASAFGLAGKIQFYHNPDTKMALAAGLLYRSWTTNMTIHTSVDDFDADLPNVTTLYLVLDKEWESFSEMDWKWTGTVGLAYDSFSSSRQKSATWPFYEDPDLPISADGTIESKTFLTPFLGVKTSNGDWTFLADLKLQEKNKKFIYSDTAWSLAARKSFAESWTATAGLTTFNIPYAKSDVGWFVDVSYQFAK